MSINFNNILLLLDSDSDLQAMHYSTKWYENIDNITEEQFIETFRMPKRCMNEFIKRVERGYKSKDAEKECHIIIFFVSHINTYRKMREIFGVAQSTINDTIARISEHIYTIATEETRFPDDTEMIDLRDNFFRGHSRNNIVVSIDGTHFEVTCPTVNPFDHLNRNKYFSINVICLVDYRMRFRAVTYGMGKSHDSRILRPSDILNLMENMNREFKIAGDAAFRAFDSIIVPEAENHNHESLELKSQRIHVENAFARFKNKFKRFSVRVFGGEKQKNIKILYSAFWVHNFIIENN